MRRICEQPTQDVDARDRRRGVRVVPMLAIGLALIAAGIGVTLSGSPMRVVGANSIKPVEPLVHAYGEGSACQSGEALPTGASAVRLALQSVIGPRVSVRALSGHRLVASGTTGSGWAGAAVTVPIEPARSNTTPATVCFTLGPSKEAVEIMGEPTSAKASARGPSGELLGGKMAIEYLRPAHRSWVALARGVARRMGLGKAPTGGWIALLLAAVMGVSILGACWLTIRDMR